MGIDSTRTGNNEDEWNRGRSGLGHDLVKHVEVVHFAIGG
jgi:hypothetical protein